MTKHDAYKLTQQKLHPASVPVMRGELIRLRCFSVVKALNCRSSSLVE